MFQSLQRCPVGQQRRPNVRQFVISVVPIGTVKLQCAHRSGRYHARQWAVVPIGTVESGPPPLRILFQIGTQVDVKATFLTAIHARSVCGPSNHHGRECSRNVDRGR
jgi:hypothetical protein